jgi:hypothetical protein
MKLLVIFQHYGRSVIVSGLRLHTHFGIAVGPRHKQDIFRVLTPEIISQGHDTLFIVQLQPSAGAGTNNFYIIAFMCRFRSSVV